MIIMLAWSVGLDDDYVQSNKKGFEIENEDKDGWIDIINSSNDLRNKLDDGSNSDNEWKFWVVRMIMPIKEINITIMRMKIIGVKKEYISNL